ncbi:polysaccharide biosynthesis protein [Consotaella salsifontis]|uniref:O-antigen biosynthesis protein WbqV n=1 Tax=Consotaella salsifontis TaxID=1365950 RepID=A0A1T4PKT2_9HYPH|nr:nucleoside-diphosphate sugar epimerase/dehydratase [Consotaella salsifontis]SJZ91847.1 O-antigen biosynthesis protein WbqV [Consotaella salsifontis]
MSLSRPHTRMLLVRGAALFHDIIMGTIAFLLSLVLRLDFDGLMPHLVEYIVASLMFGIIVSAFGFLLGMNRGVWRYASLPDLVAIVKAATASVLLFIAIHFFLVRLDGIPRSSIIVVWAFLIVLLGGPRVAYRVYRNERDTHRGKAKAKKRALLIGAGDAADLFLKVIKERSSAGFEVLAIIDERGRRAGRFIQGVPVKGPLEMLGTIIEDFHIRGLEVDALIVAQSADANQAHELLVQLVAVAGQYHLELLRLPNLLEMRSLDQAVEVQPVKVEDLLQRPPVKLDMKSIAAMISDKSVLITGAGGSIGSELVRQVARLKPRNLVLLDANEYLLYSIDMEMARDFRDVPRHALLCNVRERESVFQVMETHRPEVVFHAAALKHVPIVEAQPLQGLFTNAIGTRHVAEAAIKVNAQAVVLVSTDKAVNSTNAMGATKRLAEMFCQAMDLDADATETRFVTVRFGNVLGSSGSVVPLFERQIKAGGPVTVTHPEIERYFMTIPEACLLVMQAAAYGLNHRGERGRIFVLDMGAPVKIVDLARNLIRLSGLRPELDIKIVYTGLRPGEKLYEELFSTGEALKQTNAEGILTASPRAIEGALIIRIFDELRRMIETNNVSGALRLLKATVSDFNPGEEIQSMMDMDHGLPLDPPRRPITIARQDGE